MPADHTGIDEVNISEIKNPNFDSLPQGDLQHLHMLHYRVADRFLSYLSPQLNEKVDFHSITATQISGEDFLGYLDKNLIQTDIHLQSVGAIHLIFSPNLATLLLDRMLGNTANSKPQKEFSSFETVALKTLIRELYTPLSEEWSNIFYPEHLQEDLHVGSFHLDNRASLRSSYVFFVAYFTVGNSDVKKIVLAYPSQIIRKLMIYEQKVTRPLNKRVFLFPKTLQSIFIPVSGVIGETSLPMSDIRSLEVGDIVTLPTRIYDAVEVRIGDQVKLFAQPGNMESKLSLKILSSETPQKAVYTSAVMSEPLIDYTVPKALNRKASTPSLQPELSEETNHESGVVESIQEAPPIEEAIMSSVEQADPVDSDSQDITDLSETALDSLDLPNETADANDMELLSNTLDESPLELTTNSFDAATVPTDDLMMDDISNDNMSPIVEDIITDDAIEEPLILDAETTIDDDDIDPFESVDIDSFVDEAPATNETNAEQEQSQEEVAEQPNALDDLVDLGTDEIEALSDQITNEEFDAEIDAEPLNEVIEEPLIPDAPVTDSQPESDSVSLNEESSDDDFSWDDLD
ncbi:hypothetical protein HOH87_03440 [bacterium]|jgi:flagellar motor switch protein FliM|nr:hypothetical protein [bacterium]